MKEWISILVGHHDSVGKAIMDYEQQGSRLHTAGMGGSFNCTVNHYLLFERGE